jgi:hypothetical protein
MITKKPLNVDDDDLIDGLTIVEKPLSYPTEMAFFLQRCRLGEVSRHIVDRTSLIMARTAEPNREDIMDVDTEVQMLMNDLPVFFTMSEEDLVATYGLSQRRAAGICQQGHNARFLLHVQRCKLHLPYFTRGFSNMTYAPSKEICLSSARLIIQSELDIENTSPRNHYKFCSLVLGIYMSSIVLLMDFCINRNSPYRDRQRKDVAEAFRLLLEGKKESEAASHFVDSLMQILKKHNLAPFKVASTQSTQKDGPTRHQLHTPPADGIIMGNSNAPICPNSLASQSPSHHLDMNNCTNMTVDWTDGNLDLTSYLNVLDQSFEIGIEAGNINWENIFSDLGSTIIDTTMELIA